MAFRFSTRFKATRKYNIAYYINDVRLFYLTLKYYDVILSLTQNFYKTIIIININLEIHSKK